MTTAATAINTNATIVPRLEFIATSCRRDALGSCARCTAQPVDVFGCEDYSGISSPLRQLRATPASSPRVADPHRRAPGLLPTREAPGRELGVIRTKAQHRADSSAVPRPCPSETGWQGRDYET